MCYCYLGIPNHLPHPIKLSTYKAMFKKATVKKVRYRRDAFSHQPFSITFLYEYNFSMILNILITTYATLACKMENVQTICIIYNKSLVSLATHSQSRLNSFQTVKTLFCIALPGHLDFICFLGCALFLARRLAPGKAMQKRVFTVWNEFSLDWLCVARLTRLLL